MGSQSNGKDSQTETDKLCYEIYATREDIECWKSTEESTVGFDWGNQHASERSSFWESASEWVRIRAKKYRKCSYKTCTSERFWWVL